MLTPEKLRELADAMEAEAAASSFLSAINREGSHKPGSPVFDEAYTSWQAAKKRTKLLRSAIGI